MLTGVVHILCLELVIVHGEVALCCCMLSHFALSF